MSARLIYKQSRNAVVRVPQAPITISRRKPSAPLRVTCHVTTSLWRCAVTVTRHLLRLEKFDNRHSTHGLVAKLIEQA